jgi:spermidine synthase
VRTIEEAGLRAVPYHVYVPSFGEWGFVLAARGSWTPPQILPDDLRFLSRAMMPELFAFPRDMARVDTEVNRLNTQALVRYYEEEWRAINR